MSKKDLEMKQHRSKHPLSMAKWKYSLHRGRAKFRNIDFDFTFEDWYNWWLLHGVDKNIDQKWDPKKRPCMCRIKDIGPYSLTNVYFGTVVDNNKDSFKNNVRKRKPKCKFGNTMVTPTYLKEIKIPEWRISQFFPENYDKYNKLLSDQLTERYFKKVRNETLEQFIKQHHYWPDPYKTW